MKVDKQLPVVTSLDPRERAQAQLPGGPVVPRRNSEARAAAAQQEEKLPSKGAGFNLQLNQQLSSMQSAERYLAMLSERLAALKLDLSRQLSSPQSSDRSSIERSVQQVNTLLEQRATLSGETLDASLKLRLNEPLRSRFSLQGLESIDAIQRSGKETLLFGAGRHLAEPVAVALDDNMSDEQILRRFNATLGRAGLRAELDEDGGLKFSAPEADWRKLKEQLAVQGEDKLFAKGKYVRLSSQEDGLLGFPTELKQETLRELRQFLDSVVSALDRVSTLRDQLNQRQADVREFLARQESRDEKQWALAFASSVFESQGRAPARFAAVSQTVVTQANLTRFAVVSLLS